MIVSKDAISSSQADGVGQMVVSHTCNANAKILVVCSHVETNTTVGGWAITDANYNGVALTKITSNTGVSGTDTDSVELWYVLNPTSGANNYTINYTGVIDACIVGAISFYGVDTITGTIDSSAVGTASSTTSSTSTTTVKSDTMIVAAVAGSGSTVNLVPIAGMTEQYNIQNVGNFKGAMGIKASPARGANAMGWTMTSQRWVQCMASFASLRTVDETNVPDSFLIRARCEVVGY